FLRDIGFSASIYADGLPLEQLAASGGRPAQLTDGTLIGLGFDYQPNGPWIAITTGAGRETWTNKGVQLYNPSRGYFTALTDGSTAAFSPAWSPDGSQLAYVAAADAGHIAGEDPGRDAIMSRRIWLMNADGSNKRQLTSDESYGDDHPRWSADGSQIIFARLDADDQASLWTASASRGDLHQLVGALSLSVPP